MLIIPPVPYRKRRAQFGPPPSTPTTPLTATGVPYAAFGTDDGEVTIEFNTTEAEPLASVEAASPEKWWARFDGRRYDALAPSLGDFNTINMAFSYSSMEAGPNEVGYTNAPSDISDVIGRQLAAFVLPL